MLFTLYLISKTAITYLQYLTTISQRGEGSYCCHRLVRRSITSRRRHRTREGRVGSPESFLICVKYPSICLSLALSNTLPMVDNNLQSASKSVSILSIIFPRRRSSSESSGEFRRVVAVEVASPNRLFTQRCITMSGSTAALKSSPMKMQLLIVFLRSFSASSSSPEASSRVSLSSKFF